MNSEEMIKEIGEGAEVISEVKSSNGSTLARVAVVGAVVALGIGAVMYVRKRRMRKAEEAETEEIKTITEKTGK